MFDDQLLLVVHVHRTLSMIDKDVVLSGFVRSCSLEGVAPTHVPLANYITRSVLVDRLL